MPVERSDEPRVVPLPVAPAKRPVPPSTTHVMSNTEVRPAGVIAIRNVPWCTRRRSSPFAAVIVIVPGPKLPVPDAISTKVQWVTDTEDRPRCRNLPVPAAE